MMGVGLGRRLFFCTGRSVPVTTMDYLLHCLMPVPAHHNYLSIVSLNTTLSPLVYTPLTLKPQIIIFYARKA